MVDLGQLQYPFLPVRLLLRDRFATIEKIHRIRTPLLAIAGDRDRIVPTDSSRGVYDAAVAAKELLVISGADHNDVALPAGDDMIPAMARFLQTLK